MTVLVDTGVFYAAHDVDAARHDVAVDSLTAILRGARGQPYTSDYVYDEAVTLARARTDRFELAKAVGDRILGNDPYPDAIVLRPVTDEVFERARRAFERYSDHVLSFTDATTVALIESDNIDAVLSFDDDFDGVVDRLDPAAL